MALGGSDRARPFQGQLSGLYYNGLKVLNLAAEGNANVKINGSVRLVGDGPGSGGSGGSGGPGRSTATPPEMSTTFIETTTTMSTTTTRKHRSSPTVQVRALPPLTPQGPHGPPQPQGPLVGPLRAPMGPRSLRSP